MSTQILVSSAALLLLSTSAYAQTYSEAAPPVGDPPVVPNDVGALQKKSEAANADKAEDPLSIAVTGQVRLREEMHRHLFSPGDPSGNIFFDLTHLRSRAALTMRRGTLSAVVEMQDIRWLGQAGTVEDSEGMDLRRGALRVDTLGDTPSWLEAGRMVLAYGDQRLIGHLEWVNQARTFDGGRLRLILDQHFSDAWFDAFFTVTRETKDAHDDQYFGGIYASYAPKLKGWRSEYYALSLIDRLEAPGEMGTGRSSFATLGTRQAYKHDGVDAAAELALQAGKFAGDKMLAYAGAIRASYTFESSGLRPRLGGELVYGSGDEDVSDGDQGTFQNLFPTNHLHYGYADQAAWSNLTAAKASVGMQPSQRWRADLDYHHLRLSEPGAGWYNAAGALVRPGVETAPAHLGDEIDFVGTFWWQKGLVLEAGYALFLPGRFVEATDASDTRALAHFGYLQLQATLN